MAPRYLSPLRYPGGKAKLASFVAQLIEAQPTRPTRYVEPYAGGAGVGLRLLFDEYVNEITLNDLNAGVAALWRSIFNDPGALADRIAGRPPTVDEWHIQKKIYTSAPSSDLDYGFATLFLNRTNRSGILDARPIGGYDQTGAWKIDARYDRDRLIARVELLARYASRVTITERDGVDLIREALGDDQSFIYADPPYLVQGDRLYLNAMAWDDHESLATVLRDGPARWLLTYDADDRITNDLYAGLRCAQFSMSHSASIQRRGTEYAVFPDGLVVPGLDLLGLAGGEYLEAAE